MEQGRAQTAPFQIQFLHDASQQTQSLLPAAYRTGPDDADLAPPRLDDLTYLEKELGQRKLEKWSPHLWIAGRPTPPRPLHYQLVLSREIVITERMDLHLVWSSGRIYIKPIPRFLLAPRFWDEHLSCHHGHNCPPATDNPCARWKLRRSALGFLFSYAAMICHESDFFLAKEKHLLPDEVRWADWRLLAEQIDTKHIYNKIDVRFIYGELRLSRLNKLQYLESGLALRGYMPHWNRYGDFFHDNFAWLASVMIYIAIVLTAMQLGLETTRLSENKHFHSASYGFVIFSLVGPLLAIILILATFCYFFVSNFVGTVAFRNRRLAYIRRVADEV